jgi:hypothetical protein
LFDFRLPKRRRHIPNKSGFLLPNIRRPRLVPNSQSDPYRNCRRRLTGLKTTSVQNRIETKCCKRIWRRHFKISRIYELVHEKEKFKAISDELDQTFAEMSGY